MSLTLVGFGLLVWLDVVGVFEEKAASKSANEVVDSFVGVGIISSSFLVSTLGEISCSTIGVGVG